jgi:hypothetical protein
MSLFMRWWLDAAAEVRVLREHVAMLERQWLRAELDADYWYFEANNPDEARERRRALASTAALDARAARQETAERWAALDAAGRKAS